MAWTYDPELALPRDQVRLLVGDTDADDPQFQDEELDFLVAAHASVYSAAAVACRSLAGKYARYADKWVGDLKILASQKARAYERLAEQYDKQSVSDVANLAILGVPTAGGVYVSEKEQQEADAELVKPFLKRGMHDNVG